LSGKEFQKDGAATANARLARCLCVPGIGPVTRHRCSYHNVTWVAWPIISVGRRSVVIS